MPKYVILDADAFDRAILHRSSVSDPRAAIEAVPQAVTLPARVVVVDEQHATKVVVVEDGDAEVVARSPEA